MQINQHPRFRKKQTRLTEADNNGMLLIDDVGEYAELVRQKMDFINRDNASAAEKIQEIKTLIEGMNSGENVAKTVREEINNLKTNLHKKIDTTIDNKSVANISEIKTHVSDKTSKIHDGMKEIRKQLNDLSGSDEMKSHVTSEMSSVKNSLLEALPSTDFILNQFRDIEDIKSLRSEISSVKNTLMEAETKRGEDHSRLGNNIAKNINEILSSKMSSFEKNVLGAVQKEGKVSSSSIIGDIKSHVTSEMSGFKNLSSKLQENASSNRESVKSHVTSQISSLEKNILGSLQTSKNASVIGDSIKNHIDNELLSLSEKLVKSLKISPINEESIKSHIVANLNKTEKSLLSSLQTIDSDGVKNVKNHVTMAIDSMKSSLMNTIENAMKGQKGGSGGSSSSDIQYLIEEGNETQRNVKSLFNDMEKKKRDEMDTLLGLTGKASQSVKNSSVLEYLELDLCEKNLFISYAGALCGDMGQRYDKISNTIPSCKSYFQAKKNGEDATMSESCEYSLAKIASTCLENETCAKCGTDGSYECRENCWYMNDRGQSKFTILPQCESMLQAVSGSYRGRQYMYSLNRITQCETKMCKHREISNNMQYAPSACNLSLDEKGALDNMTPECLNYLTSMYPKYEKDCNESFEEQYNKTNICTANRSTILQPLA